MISVAKYEKIVEWITAQIENGELSEGDKIYSENELMSIFQMSRQTVRHAISVLVEKGLLFRKRGSGTYVKGAGLNMQGRKKTMCIAVMMTYVDSYIFPSIISEMEKILSKEDYNLQISFTNNTVEREKSILTNFLKNDSIDGIIAEATKSGLPNPNLELYRELQRRGIPVVFVNCFYPELEAIHVSMDDFEAGRIATEHLLQCGHQKIGAIFKMDDGQGHKRYAGYVNALMQKNIVIRDRCITWIDTTDFLEMEWEAERYLQRLKECTACVCYNDQVAVKLVQICKDSGIRIPEDLSIVGIDDFELAGYRDVSLTSVNNPLVALANNAAKSMLALLAGKTSIKSVELKPTLVVRNSTKNINIY